MLTFGVTVKNVLFLMFMVCLNTFWNINILAKFSRINKTKYSLIVFFGVKYFLSAISNCFAKSDRLWIWTPLTAFLHSSCVRKLNYKCQCRDATGVFRKLSIQQSTLYFPLTPIQRSEISTSIFAHFAQNSSKNNVSWKLVGIIFTSSKNAVWLV